MIISATRVRRSRAWRECCQCDKSIHRGSECVSIYGAAHRRDSPYRLWAHESCLSAETREVLYKCEARRTDRMVDHHAAILKENDK